MKEEVRKLIDGLKKSRHLCFVSDKDSITVSLSCTGEDLYQYLMSLVANAPWAMEVIEAFVDDMADTEFDDGIEESESYLN